MNPIVTYVHIYWIRCVYVCARYSLCVFRVCIFIAIANAVLRIHDALFQRNLTNWAIAMWMWSCAAYFEMKTRSAALMMHHHNHKNGKENNDIYAFWLELNGVKIFQICICVCVCIYLTTTTTATTKTAVGRATAYRFSVLFEKQQQQQRRRRQQKHHHHQRIRIAAHIYSICVMNACESC